MANQQITDIFEKLRNKLIPVFEELPTIIGNEGVNYSLEAFEKQSWENDPWEKRKSKKDEDRSLLVKSGRLKRSIRIISTTANSVSWGTDVPYAQVHNDGLLISRAAHSETFIRPRYERGKKGSYFGGMGAFRKMTSAERNASPKEGLSFKSYSYRMTMRKFLGDTPDLRQRLKDKAIQTIQTALKQ